MAKKIYGDPGSSLKVNEKLKGNNSDVTQLKNDDDDSECVM
jgi:hypothetical protein